MKRSISIIAALLLCSVLRVGAQQVVIDPSQIAASATNAAEQVDYMLDQLGELAEVGNKLQTMRDHIDNVFGEDGIGGKTLSILNDLGTLDRLTKAFNSTMKKTEEYARMMEDMKKYKLSDANTMLMYLNEMKAQAMMAIDVAKKIINTLGLSKKEKKEEVEKIIDEMETDLKKAEKVIRIEQETTMMAEGLSSLMDFVDNNMSKADYVDSRKAYGNIKEAGKGSMSVLAIVIALLGILSTVYGMIVFVRGGLAGDATVDNVFLRVAVGTAAGLIMITLISTASGLNL